MSGDVPAHFFLVLCLVASRILPGGPVVQRPHDVPFCPDDVRTMPGRCPVWIGARSSPFGMGGGDRRFSRTPIPMKGDRCALIAVRQRETSVCDRPASVPSAWQGHTGRRHGPGRDETPSGDGRYRTRYGDGRYDTRHHPRHRTPRRAIRHATPSSSPYPATGHTARDTISYPMMSDDVR